MASRLTGVRLDGQRRRDFCQLPQANPQTTVGFGKARLPPTVAQHSSQHFQLPTGMPFRTVRRSPKYRDGFSPGLWAYHFFDSTALNPTMSNACSATSCLSLRFSSSS